MNSMLVCAAASAAVPPVAPALSPSDAGASKSHKRIADARGDVSRSSSGVAPFTLFRQETLIRSDHGILFSTYVALRPDAHEQEVSRQQRVVDWLGHDFGGLIVFDEIHAIQNAASETFVRIAHEAAA